MRGRNATKENAEVIIDSRPETQRLDEKQFMYYKISRAFIGIPGILVSLYRTVFPTPFVAKGKENLPIICRTILTPQSSPCLCNCLFLLPQTADRRVERHYHPIVHYIVVVECACEDIPISDWEESRSKLASQQL
jgi:hypothetical protein